MVAFSRAFFRVVLVSTLIICTAFPVQSVVAQVIESSSGKTSASQNLKDSGELNKAVETTFPVNINVQGSNRHFIVHLPPGHSSKRRFPALIFLHGAGGTSQSAIEETGWDKKADRCQFIVAFPDGSRKNPFAAPSLHGNSQTWDDGSKRFPAANDLAFINELINQLIKYCNADPKRIYVSGFSNGASMAFRVGAALSERVAAIAPVSGAYWNPASEISRPVSMLYITGAADPLNPIQGGIPKLQVGQKPLGSTSKPPLRDSINAWLKLDHLPSQPVHSSKNQGVSMKRYANNAGVEVLIYTIDGAGHTWPGGKSILPESVVGATTNKLNANDLIWEFFKQHRLP